jgi:hypothetical protein
MRSILLSLLTILIAVDATAESRQLNFADFDEVSAGSAMRVTINQGGVYRLEANGSAGDLDRLRVRHVGSRLTFSLEPSFWSLFDTGQISLNITVPTLRNIQLSGASTGILNIQCGSVRFNATLSGASKLSGQVVCGDIQLSLSGASSTELSGTGQMLLLKGSGASRCDLRNLPVKHVRLNLSGASHATVNLDGGLEANLSGASQITYFGNAALDAIRMSGGSSLRKGL